MAEKARKEGILALESVGQGMAEPFIKDAVQLAVDGTEPDLIIDIMKTWMNSLMHEHETKYKKVIEAIMAIQSGDNPRIIEHKLEVIF
jgi:chemotaxis protein MotA